MLNPDHYIVTIRSTGERTKDACIKSILDDGIEEKRIHIVQEAPFKKALETCFKTAINQNVKWLLTVDADMIIAPGTLQPFFDLAERMPENFLQIQGKIIDKFTGLVRKGGPRIYRAGLLEQALELSESLKDHIRPESRIISMMGERGYPSRYITPVICYHDFEQYYRDVYRKSYVHAVKHEKNLPNILEHAVKCKDLDPDYQVILKAIYDSLSGNKRVKIDRRILVDEAKMALSGLGLTEKDNSVGSIDVQSLAADYPLSEADMSFHNVRFKDVPVSKSLLKGNVIFKNLEMNGIFRGSLYLIGLLLTRSGNFFTRIAKQRNS